MPARSERHDAHAHPSRGESAAGHGRARHHLLRAAIQSKGSYAAVFLSSTGARLVVAPVASPSPSEPPNTFGPSPALVVNKSISLWRRELAETTSKTHGRPRGRSSYSQAAHRLGLFRECLARSVPESRT